MEARRFYRPVRSDTWGPSDLALSIMVEAKGGGVCQGSASVALMFATFKRASRRLDQAVAESR